MKSFYLSLVAVLVWAVIAFGLNYTDLYPYFPEIPGFKAEAPTGMTVTTPAGDMTTVERTYHSGGKTLRAQIMVGGMAQGMWYPLTLQISYDSPEERLETLTLEGFPAKRITRKREKGGTIVILLSKKNAFPLALFVLECQGITPTEAQKHLKHFRLKELAQKLRP